MSPRRAKRQRPPEIVVELRYTAGGAVATVTPDDAPCWSCRGADLAEAAKLAAAAVRGIEQARRPHGPDCEPPLCTAGCGCDCHGGGA